MRGATIVLLALTLSAASGAQEVGLYAAGATPGTFDDQTFGAGGSVAAFFRLGSIFSDEVALSRSRLRVGVRIGYTEYRASQHRDYRCTVFFEPCVFDPHTAYSQMGITNAAILIPPYWGKSLRVELGLGLARYTFRGEGAPDKFGWTGSFAVSRRLLPTHRWWVSVDYTNHGPGHGTVMADGSSFDPPNHSLKAGLTYRLH